jgi:hypothetical protein
MTTVSKQEVAAYSSISKDGMLLLCIITCTVLLRVQVLVAQHERLKHQLAEPLTSLVVSLQKKWVPLSS